jgi:hypothetical protein
MTSRGGHARTRDDYSMSFRFVSDSKPVNTNKWKMRRTSRLQRRRGVSEVVGALLIILILISALASLAFFLSTSQKQAQVRNSYLSGVQDDDLQIIDAQFWPSVDHPGDWANMNVTIENLSTQGSELAAIGVNGSWLRGWDEVDPLMSLGPVNNAVPLAIPSKASVSVELSFTNATDFPYGIDNIPSISSPMTIVVESASGNFFSKLYSPPTAIGTASTQTANYGGVTRDTIDLDGSKSQAVGGSIQSYSWRIDVATVAGGCTLSSPDVFTVDGETIQYPSEMFSSGSGMTTFSLMNDCVNGPIEATLTVTDQNGFNSTSQPLVVPADPNIDPAGSITVSKIETPGTSGTSTSATSTTLTYSAATWTANQWVGFLLKYTSGPAAGQVQPILSNTGDTITTSAFSPAPTPGGGDTFVVESLASVTVKVYDAYGNSMSGQVVNAVPVFGDVSSTPLSQATDGTGCSGGIADVDTAGQATFCVSYINGGSMDFETGTLLPAELTFP